jgi:hypothetical protein
MAKKKSAAETLQQVKERGSEVNTKIINGDPVHTKLQPIVERNYRRLVDLWLMCVTLTLPLRITLTDLNRYQ